MQAILLMGIQATGKSTFFRERFFDSHVRLNLDMLRTRNRESIMLAASFSKDGKKVKLPSSLGEMRSLESLNLHSNKVVFPEAIGRLATLSTLKLGVYKGLALPGELQGSLAA